MAYIVTGVLGSIRAKLGSFVLGVYQRAIGAAGSGATDMSWKLEAMPTVWALEYRPTKWSV